MTDPIQRVLGATSARYAAADLATIDIADGGILEPRARSTTDARGARHGATLATTFPLDPPAEHVLIRLPKARERAAMLVCLARAGLTEDGTIDLLGHNKEGARSAGATLDALVGPHQVIETRAHHRLIGARATVPPGRTTLEDWRVTYAADLDGRSFTLTSYPGVFSHGELDPATALLLDVLDTRKKRSALDVGCGAGSITVALAARGLPVTAIDVDTYALRATEESLADNGLDADVIASDVYDDLPAGARYDLIVSNPPFHQGVATSSAVTARLIDEAPEHLSGSGELWLVGNRFLDHPERLRRVFDRVDEVANDGRYRVLRARR